MRSDIFVNKMSFLTLILEKLMLQDNFNMGYLKNDVV